MNGYYIENDYIPEVRNLLNTLGYVKVKKDFTINDRTFEKGNWFQVISMVDGKFISTPSGVCYNCKYIPSWDEYIET